jgi:hypothetical protein
LGKGDFQIWVGLPEELEEDALWQKKQFSLADKVKLDTWLHKETTFHL